MSSKLGSFFQRAKKMSMHVTDVAQQKAPIVRQIALPMMIAASAGLSGCAATVDIHNVDAQTLSEYNLTAQDLAAHINIPTEVYGSSLADVTQAADTIVSANLDNPKFSSELGHIEYGTVEYDQFTAEFSQGLTRNFRMRSPAFAFSLYGQDQKTTEKCVILMSDEMTDTQLLASQMGALPKSFVESVPGNINVWRNYVALHEAAHCMQDPSQPISERELHSDRIALKATDSAGLGYMRDIVSGLRLITPLLKGDYSHATGVNLIREVRGLPDLSTPDIEKLYETVQGFAYDKLEHGFSAYQPERAMRDIYDLTLSEKYQQDRAELPAEVQTHMQDLVTSFARVAPEKDKYFRQELGLSAAQPKQMSYAYYRPETKAKL